MSEAPENMPKIRRLRRRLLTMNGSRIDSRELFATEREIIITHGEDNYRLRLTSQNKLILTK